MSHGATDKHFIQRSPERGAQTRGSVCEVTVCGAPRPGEWGMYCRGTATVASPQGRAGPRAPPWDTAG